MRSWQDFDLMASAQFALFLFSGTFVPAETYPAVLRWVVEVTPLYRSVDLIRGVTTGSWSWLQVVDVLYLIVLFAGGLVVAERRMTTLLCK
jgi:lipooligosaccharide transport system permease protein